MESVRQNADAAPALQDRATCRAWRKLLGFAVVGQIVWPAMSLGSFALMILLGRWSMWFLLPLFIYALYRTVLQRQYIVSALQMRRVLTVYPWLRYETPQSGIGRIPGAKSGDVWLRFPDPDQPERTVPVILHGHARSAWWRRRLGRGYASEKTRQVREVWFAGDPRFAGVIAVPGPRRLFLIFQLQGARHLEDSCASPSAEAVEKARSAGVRVT